LAVGIKDAVKGGDDVINFRGVLPPVLVFAVILQVGLLFIFLVFTEDLVEHAKPSFLLWGSTVLGGKGSSRLCSMEIEKNKDDK
jgi:hypothetical protein